MNLFYKKKKGFTLLELMIVVIIIGILASLALPRFIAATAKAKESEARAVLGSIRASQIRYYLENNFSYTTNINYLDVNLTASDYYNYTAIDDAGNIGQAEVRPGVSGLSNFRIDVDGNITTY